MPPSLGVKKRGEIHEASNSPVERRRVHDLIKLCLLTDTRLVISADLASSPRCPIILLCPLGAVGGHWEQWHASGKPPSRAGSLAVASIEKPRGASLTTNFLYGNHVGIVLFQEAHDVLLIPGILLIVEAVDERVGVPRRKD